MFGQNRWCDAFRRYGLRAAPRTPPLISTPRCSSKDFNSGLRATAGSSIANTNFRGALFSGSVPRTTTRARRLARQRKSALTLAALVVTWLSTGKNPECAAIPRLATASTRRLARCKRQRGSVIVDETIPKLAAAVFPDHVVNFPTIGIALSRKVAVIPDRRRRTFSLRPWPPKRRQAPPRPVSGGPSNSSFKLNGNCDSKRLDRLGPPAPGPRSTPSSGKCSGAFQRWYESELRASLSSASAW